MLLNHFMREHTRFIIFNQYLFRLEPSQLLNSFIDISGNQILIAAMQLSICFFTERHPELISALTSAKHWLFGLYVHRNSLVDNDIDPLEVFEKSEHVEPNTPKLMENGRINTLG